MNIPTDIRKEPLPIRRVLMVHNRYMEEGGEEFNIDIVTSALQASGVHVKEYIRQSEEFFRAGFIRKLLFSLQVPFSFRTYFDIKRICREFKPDIIHVHNIFPLISPSLYFAARHSHIPVVQTIHNYRFLCLNGLFLRDGLICESCIHGNIGHALLHRCFHKRLLHSMVFGLNLFLHRLLQTWRCQISTFIALSRFSKAKLVEGGLPEKKIIATPNFLDLRKYPYGADHENYLIFIGRLSHEKGLSTLLKGFAIFSKRHPGIPLHIIGDGPMRQEMEQFIHSHPEIRVIMRGRVFGDAKIDLLKKATVLIFPSECYENCPYTILESLAVGTPVIASRLGGSQELVQNGVTGSLFTPGDPESLAQTLSDFMGDPHRSNSMRHKARDYALAHFNMPEGIQKLISIYQAVTQPQS